MSDYFKRKKDTKAIFLACLKGEGGFYDNILRFVNDFF